MVAFRYFFSRTFCFVVDLATNRSGKAFEAIFLFAPIFNLIFPIVCNDMILEWQQFRMIIKKNMVLEEEGKKLRAEFCAWASNKRKQRTISQGACIDIKHKSGKTKNPNLCSAHRNDVATNHALSSNLAHYCGFWFNRLKYLDENNQRCITSENHHPCGFIEQLMWIFIQIIRMFYKKCFLFITFNESIKIFLSRVTLTRKSLCEQSWRNMICACFEKPSYGNSLSNIAEKNKRISIKTPWCESQNHLQTWSSPAQVKRMHRVLEVCNQNDPISTGWMSCLPMFSSIWNCKNMNVCGNNDKTSTI